MKSSPKGHNKSFSKFKKKDRMIDVSHQDQFIFNRTPILASALQRLKKKDPKSKQVKRPPIESIQEQKKNNKKVKTDISVKQQPKLTYTPLQRDLFTFYSINKATIKSGQFVPEPKFEIGSLVLSAISDRGIGGKYLVANLFRNKKAYIDFKQISQTNDPQTIQVYANPGDYVLGTVIKGMNQKNVQLSLKQFITINEKNIRIGQSLPAQVKSKEEVGCHLIVKSCPKYKFYLAKQDIDEAQFNLIQQKKQILVTIKQIKKESRLIKVILSSDNIYFNLKGVEQQDMAKLELDQYVVPGTLVHTKVVKIVKNGIFVKFLKIFIGYIHVDHLQKRLDSYLVDEKVSARIIYYCVNPSTLYLSQKHVSLNQYQPSRQLYSAVDKPNDLIEQQGSFFSPKNEFYLHPLQIHTDIANINKFWVKQNNYFQRYQIMCSKKLGLRVGEVSKVIPFTNFKVYGQGQGKFRIMCLDVWNKVVKVSYNPKLLKAQNLLMNLDDVNDDIKYTGFISGVNSNGVMVQFCNNIKGIIKKNELNSNGIQINQKNIGDGLEVYITNKKKGVIGLSLIAPQLRKTDKKQQKRKKSQEIIGQQMSSGVIISISVKSVNPIYIKMKSKIIKISVFKGIVPASLDSIDTILNLEKNFEIGQRVRVYRKGKQYFLYPPQQLADKQLKICRLLSVQSNYIRVQTGNNQFRNCHITDVTDLIIPYPLNELQIGSYFVGRELEKGWICLRDSIVRNGIPKTMKDYKQKYQDNELRGDYRNRILCGGSASLNVQMVLFGYIKSFTEKGCFISITNDYQVRVQICQLSDHYIIDKSKQFTTNKLIICRLVSQKVKFNQPNKKLFDGSCRQSIVKHGYPINEQILMAGLTVSGIVTGYTKGKALVRLNSSKFTGIIGLHDVENADQQLPIQKALKLGTFLKCKITQYLNDNGRKLIRLSTLKKYFDKYNGVQIEVQEDERVIQLWNSYQQMLKVKPPAIMNQIMVNEDEIQQDQYQRIKRLLAQEQGVDHMQQPIQQQGQNQNQQQALEQQQQQQENEHKNIDNDKDLQEQSQESQQSQQQISKSKGQIIKQKIPSNTPQNINKMVNQFQKMPHPPSFYQSLILANPTAQSHLMYISSLLSTSTPQQIRAQFVRAINSLTSIKDKQNMWISWLNMELILGGFMETVKKGLQSDVGLNVYMRIIQILMQQQKWNVVLEFSKKMLKKFNKDPKAYINFIKTAIQYSNKHNLPQRLTPEEIIKRAKQSLTTLQVITVQSHYGKLLYQLKQSEKARNIFEQIITKYPQRTDLWNMYTDLQIKHGQVDKARNILQRGLSVGLKRKKVMTILKKYHQLQLKHGTSESIEEILRRAKEIAQQYQNKDNQDSNNQDISD